MNRGFTLLELIIALGLMAVLLTGIAGLGARFVGNIHINKDKQDELEGIYATFHILHQDAMSYHHDFRGSLDEVSMLTVQQAIQKDINKSGQKRVIYRVENGGEGEKILYRFTQDNLMKEGGVETEIIRSPEIIFSFLGETIQEQPTWQANAVKKAPVAWKVVIADKAGRKWERTFPIMVRFNEKK